MEEINSVTPTNRSELYESVEELRLNSPIEVRDVRQQNDVHANVPITIQPADICARDSLTIMGTSRKLAPQRLLVTCERPVAVGSVFHVTFDRSVIDVDAALGLCDRCVMLNATAFEVGIQFVHQLELPVSAQTPPESIG